MRLIEVVEVDLLTNNLLSATIYLTDEEDFGGETLRVLFKEDVGLIDCWPKWPEEMGEDEAAWIVETYKRRVGGKVYYSFGLRLDLRGIFKPPVTVTEWRYRDGLVRVRANAPKNALLVVGPFLRRANVSRWRGSLREEKGKGYSYVVVEALEEVVTLEASISPVQPILTGFLECSAKPGDLPLEPRFPREYEFRGRLVIRLPDLRIT